MYLNRNNILSYNSAIAFIVLKRGFGKSYGFKTRAIERTLKDGGQTVWVRRYKSETAETITGFIDDIVSAFPKADFKMKGSTLYVNKKPSVHFVSLSTAQKLKSRSFSKVFQLIFDEFLIETGHLRYIGNEPLLFSGLLSSVFRDRKMEVFLLGNKTKVVNPYSLYFNVCDFDKVKYYPERKILVYASDRDNIIEKNYQDSDLETVLRGTQYYDFNFKNASLSDSMAMVSPRPRSLKTIFTINIGHNVVGVFIDSEKSYIYFDTNCDKTVGLKFVFDKDKMGDSYLLLTRALPYAKLIKDFYNKGRVIFNDIKTREITMPLINYLA